MQLRPIRWGPAVDEPVVSLLSLDDAVTKVRRAGAPWDALAAVGQQYAGGSVTEATKCALAWLRDRQRLPLLALCGPTGRGKTVAAARVAVEFARAYPWNSQASGGAHREPLVWLNAEHIVLLQAWMNDGARQYDEALYARFLVIDDAGHEKTRASIAALTDLLLRRIDATRATVLSSNLRGKSFAPRYGEPVADRLATRGYSPELGGESLRRTREPGEEG